MYCRSTLILLMFLIVAGANAQESVPEIQFQHAMGGTLDDISYEVVVTQDGGYFVVGGSTSSDGDLLKTTEVQHGGNYDYWFAKLDPTLNFQWKQHLGGTGSDLARKSLQLSDGGFVIGGSSNSPDLDVFGNHGDYDFWVVRLFPSGTVQWNKSYGGADYDDFGSMLSTPDGGFILAGGSQSNDGDVSGNHGSSDFWMVKTDANGNLQWQKCYGGTNYEKAASVKLCPDGGFILVGFSESNDGDVTGNHGDYDVWVVKTDASGSLQWQRSLGGSGYDAANSVVSLSDGSFIISGYTGSVDGDVTGNHGEDDAWIVKLNASGAVVWSKCLGGTAADVSTEIMQVGDEGFILACYSRSLDGDVGGNYGFWDYWLVRTDLEGSIEWQQHFGGSLNDVCYGAKPTSDGGYILTGYSESQNFDVSGNHGKKDYWVVKLQGTVGVEEVALPEMVINVYPQPAKNMVYLKLPDEQMPDYNKLIMDIYDVTGRSIHSGPVGFDPLVKIDCSLWGSGIYLFRLMSNGTELANGKIAIQ
jgi:hypothetical protein